MNLRGILITKSKENVKEMKKGKKNIYISPGGYETDENLNFDFMDYATNLYLGKDGYVYAVSELSNFDFDILSKKEEHIYCENDIEAFNVIKENFKKELNEIYIYTGEKDENTTEFEPLIFVIEISEEKSLTLLNKLAGKCIEDILEKRLSENGNWRENGLYRK